MHILTKSHFSHSTLRVIEHAPKTNGLGKRKAPKNWWNLDASVHQKCIEKLMKILMIFLHVFGWKYLPNGRSGDPKIKTFRRHFVDISWPCPRDPSGEANGAKMEPKWRQNGAKTEPKWSQNEFKMRSKWCQKELKLKAPKFSENEARILQNPSES